MTLPANCASAFSFWTIEDNDLVELDPAVSYYSFADDSAILIGEKRHQFIHGNLLIHIVQALDKPKALKELAKAVHHDSRSQLLQALFRLYDAKLIRIWRKNYSHDYSVEYSLSESRVAQQTSVYLTCIGELTEDTACCVNQALATLGFKISSTIEDADICLVITDTYLRREHFDICSSLLTIKPVVPAKLFGSELWVGPLFQPESGDILQDFKSRLFLNFPTEARVLNKNGIAAPGFNTASSWTLKTGSLILARLLQENLSETNPESLKQNCITFSYKTLKKRFHTLLPPSSKQPSKCALSSAHSKHIDGGRRSVAAHEFLAHVSDLISPITGLVPDIVHESPGPGLHVCHTIQIEPDPLVHRLNRRVGTRFGAAGKGETIEQAKASCIGEALERYSACYQGNEIICRESIFEATQKSLQFIDPRDILLFSEKQYKDRAQNSEFSFHFVPKPVDQYEPIDWVRALRWRDRTAALVPASCVLFNYNEHSNDREISFADSNGCAVGVTIVDAVLQGTLELIERDACAIWWYNQIKVPEFDLSTASRPFIHKALQTYDALGRDLVVLDLTADLGIPVACAVSWKKSGAQIGVGLGCSLDSETAISRAICELNQFISSIATPGTLNERIYDKEIAHWLETTSIENTPFMRPNEHRKTILSSKDKMQRTIREDVDEIVEILHRNGLDTYFVDLTRPETKVHCVKVIVPRLRHFWARYAPGRLYEVPVTLGWIPHSRDEDQLNPTPFFL